MIRFDYLLALISLSTMAGVPAKAQKLVADPLPLNSPAADSRDTSQEPESGFAQRYPRYTLRSGDTFDINFPFSPEFNQSLTVEPDGFVTFRGAGSVHVAGQTIPQLTDTITKAYVGVLHDPAVTVALKDFEKPYFIAGGEVGKPGKYDLRSDISLVEAINIAGGFTDASKHSQVLLFRRVSNDKVEAHLFNVKKMLATHDLQEDPHLMPGDMLVVPKNFISKIRPYLPTSTLGLYGNPMIP